MTIDHEPQAFIDYWTAVDDVFETLYGTTTAGADVEPDHILVAHNEDQTPEQAARSIGSYHFRHAPRVLAALRQAQRALNTAPRFKVCQTDSYKIAAEVDAVIALLTG